MHTQTARLRAMLIPAILAVGLFGAGSVSAAEVAAVPPTAVATTVAGTGTLTADGDGFVQLGGTYVLTGTVTGGTLRISGAGYYSSVQVSGWISKTRLTSGTTIYRFGDKTGSFRISGRTIVTRVVSHSIHLTVTGHGRAWLVGTGTFSANGRGPFPWASPATTTAVDPSTTTF